MLNVHQALAASLAIGFTVLLSGCCTPGPVQPTNEQERAIATQLRALGGSVFVNEAGHVFEVNLSKTGVRDADLAKLTGLPHLKLLSLSYTGITDAGLKHLGSLRQLQQVILFKSKATDEGVDGLRAALPQCRVIN